MKPLIPEGIRLSPHYYPGMRSGNIITTAGIVPVQPDNQVFAPYDAKEQTRYIIGILKKILAEGGAGLKDVTYIHSYFVKQEYMADVFAVLHDTFGERIPPHTGTWVREGSFSSGEGICLELEFLAVVED